MKRKWLSILLAAGMVLSLMACGGQEQAGNSANESAAEAGNEADGNAAEAGNKADGNSAEAAVEKSEGKESVELVFCNWGDGTEQKMFEYVFELFEKENPGVTVKYLHIPYSEYLTKLNTMAASDTMPDLGQMQTENVLLWAENGMYADVSDLFESGAIAKRLDGNYYAEVDGKFSAANYISETNVLFYDKDYCEANGVTVPTKLEEAWTWDEFLDACVKLTKDVNGKHPGEEGFDPENIDVYAVADMDADVMAHSNGGGYFSEDGKEIWMDKPETIEAIQAVADLMNVYHVAPTPTSRDAIGGGNYPLMTGKVAMHVGGQYCMLWYADYIKSGEINLGTGVLPKFKEPANKVWGNPVVVFSSSKHPEEAKALMQFFYDNKNLIDCINMGLWMPTEEKFYTDEAALSSWIEDSGIRTEEFYGVVDMAKNGYTAVENILSNTVELSSLYGGLLDQVWLGEKTAEDVVLNEIMPILQPAFDEYWAAH